MRLHYGIALAFTLVMAPSLRAQQSYGFITRLGRDTVAVERIRRTADMVTADIVERNGQLFVRHYEAMLAPDGTVSRFTADFKVANPTPGHPSSSHTVMEFGPDSIRSTVTVPGVDTVRHIAVPVKGRTIMPWLMVDYSTVEQMFATALRHSGDSTAVSVVSPDQPQQVNNTFIRRLSADSAVFNFFGAPVRAHVSNGKLLGLSAEQTTVKALVTRLDSPPDIEAIAARFTATEKAAGPSVMLTGRDTVRAKVGSADIMLDYGTPLMRGRTIIGNVVPFDEVWRTGANAATQLMTTMPITLAGVKLDAGTYTLWTLPTASGVTLIINKQFGQWGTQHNPKQDLAKVPLTVETRATPLEKFTMHVEPGSRSGTATLVMEWDKFRWKAPIELGTGS